MRNQSTDKNFKNENGQSSQPQLIKWRDDFLTSKSLRWSPKTKRGYQNIINQYITHIGEDYWPPTRVDIINWLNIVKVRASETTAATYWRHIQAWLNYLEMVDVLDMQSNPVHIIKKLKLQPIAPELGYIAFEEEELEQLFDHLENLPFSLLAVRDLTLLRFQYFSGARSSEVAALKFQDLHLSDELPNVHIQAQTSKSRKFRVVYLNKQVKKDLTRWVRVLTGAKYTGVVVFPSLNNGKPGKPLTANGIYQMLQRRLEETGLPSRRAHALRHSSALHAIANGIDLRKIRDQLGHSSIAVTAKYLRNFDPDRGQAYKEWE